ncbi:c-type cytochrome [Sphingomonas qomolangmaensis]|uniref:C-type cytochrome n=1 Tax=Sphingomonas qomolangmaensis TaxID=2918765 RepID=A0ABY5L8K5_9SPHN|nr:c-type cytochrome [Sphingomonas qomolangmaensis]UUL82065.1 c-type cytochrome [Sphingomonas qomolangmaensis]
MKLLFTAMLVPAALSIAATPAAAQNADAGAQVFNTCRACHTLNKGGRNGAGPNLHGLFGRQAAAATGFSYSPALKASKIRWDDKTLSEYLVAPTKRVPGTRMMVKVPDAAKRAALIAYLKRETSK